MYVLYTVNSDKCCLLFGAEGRGHEQPMNAHNLKYQTTLNGQDVDAA